MCMVCYIFSWTLERTQKRRWSGEIFFCCDGIFVGTPWLVTAGALTKQINHPVRFQSFL